MICFDTNIDDVVVSFFRANLKNGYSLEDANNRLKTVCGIVQFFKTQEELIELQTNIEISTAIVEEPNRRAYGDFQTNINLADEVVKKVINEDNKLEFLLEPTCGKGTFIIAALKVFKTLKKVVGVEIYYPYIWATKFGILELHLTNKAASKPEIEIVHTDVFSYSFAALAKETKLLKTLILGNPPWVTNSELGLLNSKNLPSKSNFKRNKGLDAMTGKGNFDIGEYISLLMLKYFDKHRGYFAFLVKSAVVKQLMLGQKKAKYRIENIKKIKIDAKKEFNVSVDACLIFAQFNLPPSFTCEEYDFYSGKYHTKFGWYKDKFVHSIEEYDRSGAIDGLSQLVWRQGIKHDCSKIMELTALNGHYINGFKKEVILEDELLYGLLKSSDLKEATINSYRKTTIVTQKKIGQDTSYIETKYPKTYAYLKSNKFFFDKRKSSIYKGKPSYSIFGVGDYSFALYKIAISGMYKRTTFSLVPPENGKPIMLDDTCYFIGFDNLIDAQIAQFILNSEEVQRFMKSIIFPSAKRSITKDVLMRIDLKKVYKILDKGELKDITRTDWTRFKEKWLEENTNPNQMALF